VKKPDITASTKAAEHTGFVTAPNRNSMNLWIILPLQKHLGEAAHHV
jgi:hypothetical protein